MSTDSILRFNANSGAFIDDFVSSGSGGLDNPHGFAFDAAGNLYVGSSGGDNSVLRYAAATGAQIDQIVPSGEDGLNGPRELLFDAVGNLYVVDMRADNVLRYGAASQAVFTVSLSKPSALPVSVDFTTADGTAAAGIDFATTSGTLVFEPGVTSRTIAVPTVDDTVAEPEESFFVNLSNPSGGAAIADDHAVATIVDDNDAIVLGDLNGDGKVNGLDADLFVAALLDNTDDVAADMNQDGVVNGLDVDWFVAAVVRKPLPDDVNVDARVNLGGSSRPVAHHN